LDSKNFLITPHKCDRFLLTPDEIVRIHDNRKEYGKVPSKSVHLHKEIFDTHPHINSIITANPPHAMAFAVTDADFDSRIIPESYIQLRDVVKASDCKTGALNAAETYIATANALSLKTPALIRENEIITTGNTLLQAYDRMEVCEATAKAIIAASNIGEPARISPAQAAEIDEAFGLGER
jgi:L-fuculose-phosphate aldolase